MRWLGIILVVCGVHSGALGQGGMPADANGDGRIEVAELGAYYAAVADSLGGAGADVDPVVVQARFIWAHGEAFTALPGIESPYQWVPTIEGAPGISVDQRVWRPLEWVRVPEVTDDGSGATPPVVEVSAGPGELFEVLEAEWGPDGVLRFRAPYVPMSLLDTPRFWGRVAVAGGYRSFGWVDYENARPESLSLSLIFERQLEDYRRMAPGDSASAASRWEAGEELTDDAAVLGYYDLYYQYLIDVATALEAVPLEPETRLTMEIAADLLFWRDPSLGEAPESRALSLTRGEDDCPSIVQPPGVREPVAYNLLADLSFARCLIEAEIDDEDSLKKQITDKAIEKIPEMVTKLTKRLGKTASKRAGSNAARVITIAVETRSYNLAMSAASLPKYVTRLTAVPRGLAPQGHYLIDGPRTTDGLNCSFPEFSFEEVRVDVRSDTFSFADYLIDNKIPETDEVLDAISSNSKIPGKSLVIPLIENATRGARKRALDSLKERVDPVDVEWRPCEWLGIEVPDKYPSDRFETYTLTAVSGSALTPVSVQRYVCSSIGAGPMDLSLNTADLEEPEAGVLPCLEPYIERVSWDVVAPEVEVEPGLINLTSLDQSVSILGILTESWDHELLSWRVVDRFDQEVATGVTEEPLNHLYPAATHAWEFFPPTDPDRYPLTVTGQSQSFPCVNKPGYMPPEATALVFYREPAFVLEAEEVCLELETGNLITAIPEDPDQAFELTWSVVKGEAEIQGNLGELTATLYVGPEPQREVRIRAETPSGFFQEKSFSVGSCLGGVQIWADFDPSFFQDARSGTFVLAPNAFTSVGGGGVGLGFAPPAGAINPDFSGLPDSPAVDLGSGYTAFGTLAATVEAVEYEPSGDAGWMDLYLRGSQLVGFDENHPFGVGFDSTVSATGLYTFEIDPEPYFPLVYQPSSMLEFPEGDYLFDVALELPWDANVESFENVAVSFYSLNGRLDGGSSRLDETGEYRIFTQTVQFDREEMRPHIGVQLSGLVEAPTLEGDQFFGLDYTGDFVWNRIHVDGETRIFFTQEVGGYALCDFPQAAIPEALHREGCCGTFQLSGYQPMSGAVGQQAAIQWIYEEPFDAEEPVGQAWGLWIGESDVEGSFCSDFTDLVDGPDPKPGPPEPDPDPDPDPEPEPGEDPTPPALQNFFADTPMSSGQRFAPVSSETALAERVVQTASLVDEPNIAYPMILGFGGEVVLRRFGPSGELLQDIPILDAETYDALGANMRLVAWTEWGGENVLIVERTHDAGIDIERWAFDPEKIQWTGRRLMPTTEARPAIGVGSFTGDDFVDVLTLDSDRAVYRHAGGADASFGSGVLWFDVGEGWRVRAVVPWTTPGTYLCLQDNFLGRYAIEFRDADGAVVGSRIEGDKALPLEQIMAPADFGADGLPDLILHVPFFENFTVAPIGPDGSVGDAASYAIPLLGEIPGLK